MPGAAFHIVVNAGSGSDDAGRRCAVIREVLEGAGRTCHIELVHDGAELGAVARRMAAAARAGGGVLVAAGGDGTINAVAHEAVPAGCAFGVLPQGTFNYFARAHGIPEDLEQAARALLTARVKAVQVGMVNDRVFLVNASVGLYPKLLEERESDKAQFGRSRVVAVLSALKTALGRHPTLRIQLERDGEASRLRTTTLFIGNNRLQMEQVGMAPLTEAIEDGQLVALAPRSAGPLALAGLFLRGALGRLGEADDLLAFGFRRLSVRKAIYRRRSIKVATDGEVTVMQMPLEFRVLEGRLALLAG